MPTHPAAHPARLTNAVLNAVGSLRAAQVADGYTREHDGGLPHDDRVATAEKWVERARAAAPGTRGYVWTVVASVACAYLEAERLAEGGYGEGDPTWLALADVSVTRQYQRELGHTLASDCALPHDERCRRALKCLNRVRDCEPAERAVRWDVLAAVAAAYAEAEAAEAEGEPREAAGSAVGMTG